MLRLTFIPTRTADGTVFFCYPEMGSEIFEAAGIPQDLFRPD